MNDVTHPLAESVANKMSLAGCLRPTEGGDFVLGDWQDAFRSAYRETIVALKRDRYGRSPRGCEVAAAAHVLEARVESMRHRHGYNR